MAAQKESGFLLCFDELKILLYSLGKREVEGIYMPEKEFTEADIIYALKRMVDKGLITAQEDTLLIREDLKRLLEIVGAPGETAILRPDAPGAPEYFLYLSSEQVVVSELCWEKKDTVRLRIFTASEYEAWKERIKDDYSGA